MSRGPLAVAVWLSAGLIALSAWAAARQPAGDNALRVGNDRVERSLVLGDGSYVVSTDLRMGDGRNVWNSSTAPAPGYRFTIKDPETGAVREISSRDAHSEVKAESPSRDGTKSLVVHLTRSDVPVAVDLFYECYPGHAFVRRWAVLTNRGDKPFVLQEAVVEQIVLDRPEDVKALYGLERTHTKPIWFAMHTLDLANEQGASFETGRHRAATWLALERKGAPEGMVIGWETYEPAQCRIDRTDGVNVTTHPELTMNPGDVFDVPASFVGLFEGDMDEGCFRTHRFVEEHIAWPNPGDDFPYVMFNTWGYGTAVYDSLARDAVDRCHKLGVEVVAVDFGWEGPDWDPWPEAFPEGLAPIADLCHERNMKFGLHFSYANVSEQAQMYKDHPDWVFGKGAWAYGAKIEGMKVYALSLGLPEARQWITNRVVEVLDRQKIDWVITDSLLWGHIDPEKHPVPADQDYMGAKAHETTLAEIHERRPNVLLEHCDGGLSLPSYRMMRQHVTSITCDNAQALDTRISVYDLSHFMPPRYLDKYQQEWRSHYANRSCMLGGPWILMTPINTLEPGSRDWDELVEDIALYKRYRSRIRDGKVLHLLRPDDPKNAAWDGWDAIGSYNPGEDAAIVFAFRTRGENRARTIPMKALRPEGRYEVKFLDTGHAYTASGAEINRDGFKLELDAYEQDHYSQCSEIIVVEPVAAPAPQ